MDYTKQYNSLLESIENDLTPDEERESQQIYEKWTRDGRLSDLELAMFMSDKLDNITKVMHESDRLRSRDGKVSRITITETTNSNSENEKLRKEIDDLKGDIKELKQLLINKLS